MDQEVRVPLQSDDDLLVARQVGRRISTELGFRPVDVTCVVTAISELARNILMYAGAGEIVLVPINDASGPGLMVIARDQGPGISDVQKALMDGFSTSGGLGLGLPGVRRLMDEFDIVSEVGHGTTVTVKKWVENKASR
ncbi:MAG: anti-sigma regulatory factor [Chloroflexi bacterium]|nr:anti-sigma regulatory factor [Chloroflexota bacterium]